MDAQPAVTRAATSNAWPPLHGSEFQPSVNTQHAAGGLSGSQLPLHRRTAYDTGPYLTPHEYLLLPTLRLGEIRRRPFSSFNRSPDTVNTLDDVRSKNSSSSSSSSTYGTVGVLDF
ncbi:unnamed protein product, partial [Ixodes persulcatus]